MHHEGNLFYCIRASPSVDILPKLYRKMNGHALLERVNV